jgi:hypothetical protein
VSILLHVFAPDIRLQMPFKLATSPLARLFHNPVHTHGNGLLAMRHVYERDNWPLRQRLLLGMHE